MASVYSVYNVPRWALVYYIKTHAVYVFVVKRGRQNQFQTKKTWENDAVNPLTDYYVND